LHLLPHLLVGRDSRQSILPVILLGVALFISVIALAGPTWSKLPQAVYKADISRMILLDLSRSMDVQDINPSRLSRAKFKVLDLLDKIREGQVGLIVFAGEPYIVSPLTDDSATIAAMVPTLQTQLMPVQGSRLDLAFGLSDAAGETSVSEAVASLTKRGHRVSILGVGTEASAPIPLPGGGFYKDTSGRIVIPKHNVAELKQLAQDGGGLYMALSVADTDIDRYLSLSDSTQFLDIDDKNKRTTDVWRDEGAWLIFLLLPLALLVFRRGALPVVFLIFVLPMPVPSYASVWDDLWLRKDQQAAKIMEEEKYNEAAQMFQDPDWKGTAYYRGEKYKKAVEYFSTSNTAEANYNLGNALAKAGKIEDAIKAYQRVLEMDANHEDAKYNKSLLEKLQRDAGQDQQSEGEKDQASKDKSKDEKNEQGDNGDNQSNASSQDQKESSQKDQTNASNEQSDNNKKDNSDSSQDQAENKQDAAEELAESLNKNQPEVGKSEEQKTAGEKMEVTKEREEGASEMSQATEQWLSRIKDDPGGLLRQKFLREHRRRQAQSQSSQTSSEGEEW
jgi:Ca-activated chloride channel family protein